MGGKLAGCANNCPGVDPAAIIAGGGLVTIVGKKWKPGFCIFFGFCLGKIPKIQKRTKKFVIFGNIDARTIILTTNLFLGSTEFGNLFKEIQKDTLENSGSRKTDHLIQLCLSPPCLPLGEPARSTQFRFSLVPLVQV